MEVTQISQHQLKHDVSVALSEYWETQASERYDRALGRALKRGVDLSISILALIVLGIPMLLISVLTRLESTGPAVFKQVRMGRWGHTFVFYKFRTMRTNNDDFKHRAYVKSLIADNHEYGDNNQFKITDDPRVTRFGLFLRATSLDELMQLFNVIKGNMSLVGPRPALPYEVTIYDDNQRRRLIVKPGISGLWQVSGRNNLNFDQMIELDLEYIRNWSIWSDLKIIARTIPALIMYRGW